MLNPRLSTRPDIILPTLFGILIFLFWAFLRPASLSYQEQFQLFLFTPDYFLDHLSRPGDLALYLSELIVQFFYHPWVGALFLSLIFVALQQATATVARALAVNVRPACVTSLSATALLLSFVPSVLLWCYMGDPNVLLSLAVSLLLLLGLTWGYLRFCHGSLSLFTPFLIIPCAYWLLGPMVVVFTLLSVTAIIGRGRRARRLPTALSVSVLLIALTAALPFLAYRFLPYPLERLVFGLSYYRVTSLFPVAAYFVALSFVLIPWIMLALRPKPAGRYVVAATAVIIIGGGTLLLWKFYPRDIYDTQVYDQLVRKSRWQDIISKAERQHPTDPFGVTSVNLALGMTGQLGERMFQFYQHGPLGLLSNSSKDFLLPFPVSEAYYRLGMVNAAMRITFEIQEALPDYRKSVRCMKRLAECNIINGEYAVARRYLALLSHTLYYDGWAAEMLRLIDTRQTDSFREFHLLRSYNYAKDFLFSDTEMDKMLGQSFLHNTDNRMAFEYMLAWTLLRRSLRSFMSFVPYSQYVGYTRLPKAFQEAFLYSWIDTHHTLRGLPVPVDDQVAHRLLDFARILQQQGASSPALKAFADTYWYYLMVQKDAPQPIPEQQSIY